MSFAITFYYELSGMSIFLPDFEFANFACIKRLWRLIESVFVDKTRGFGL